MQRRKKSLVQALLFSPKREFPLVEEPSCGWKTRPLNASEARRKSVITFIKHSRYVCLARQNTGRAYSGNPAAVVT